MGAWHTGIYDNDIALDFMGKVAESVSEMAERNEEILVVADMLYKYSYPTPLDSALFVEVIKDELDNLDSWKEECREPRKEVLLDLLSKATKSYIHKTDNTVIYPLRMNEDGDFVVQFFSKGSDMKEMELSIDYVMSNYIPNWEDRLEITLDGISNDEVQGYFDSQEIIYGKRI